MMIGCPRFTETFQYLKRAITSTAVSSKAWYSSGRRNSSIDIDAIELMYEEKLLRQKEMHASVFINNLNEEGKKRLQRLEIEYEVMKSEGLYEMPSYMMNSDWMDMMRLNPQYQFQKYGMIKTKQESIDMRKQKEERDQSELENMIRHQTRTGVSDKSFCYLDEEHLLQSANMNNHAKDLRGFLFGRKIVFEFSKNNNAFHEENVCLALMKNRRHLQPGCMNFTNCFPSYSLNSKMLGIHNLEKEYPFIKYHSRKAVDLFPKDKLVYIIEESENMLDDNDDDIPVFFIGGKDKLGKWHVGMADRQGVRHASIPLRKYVKLPHDQNRTWKYGLFQSVGVLLDMSLSHNWPMSLMNNLPYWLKNVSHSVTELYNYVLTSNRDKKKSTKHTVVITKSLW